MKKSFSSLAYFSTLASRVERSAARGAGLLSAVLSVLSVLSSGCPVYSDNSYGRAGGCYHATDCPFGHRCTADGFCVAAPSIDAGGSREASVADAPTADVAIDASPSSDAAALVSCANPNDCAANETCASGGTCRAGDCSTHGCVNQFQCAVVTSGPTAMACVHADPQACGADHQCAKSARCVDGKCTTLADLCTDRAQCPTGSACVDGKCVATCNADSQCPSGLLCRLALEICDAKAKVCSITGDCASKDLVCVDGGCVPRCGAIGACADGGASVCVDNGCIASQKKRSACQADAGAAGCAKTPGSECDPTADKWCAVGKTCIDGSCR